MATYYVRADGSAQNKSAATDPSSASTSMSMDVFNAEMFFPGDTIVFSNRGGNFSQQLIVPTGGDVDNPIYYRGESDHVPEINYTSTEGCIYVASKDNIEIIDLASTVGNTSNLLIDGTSTGVVTRNLVLQNSGNQCVQHLGSSHADHYNLTATNGADEGLSLHDTSSCNVYGGVISGRSGVNWESSGVLGLYDCIVTSLNPSYYSIQPPTTPSSIVFKAHRCTFIEASGRTSRGPDFNKAGSVEFANCVFRNLGTTDYYLLLRSTLTTARLLNCVFYSGSITGSVVFNQLSTGVYKNNIIHTATSGSGRGFYSASGVDKTCYYLSGTTYYGSTYITTDPLLTDPSNGNYHIQAESPCRGIGADLSAYFTTDIDGQTRTVPWDIGVDQYIAIAYSLSHDLSAAISRNLLVTHDTAASVSSGLITVADTLAAIASAIDGRCDTRADVATGIATAADARTAVSSAVSAVADSRVSLSTAVTTSHDTRTTLATAISSLFDTLADISALTGYSVRHDTRLAISSARTWAADTRAGVSSEVSTVHDTRLAVSRVIAALADTLADISSAVGYQVSHDTRLEVRTRFTAAADSLAAISRQIAVAQDTRVIVGLIDAAVRTIRFATMRRQSVLFGPLKSPGIKFH